MFRGFEKKISSIFSQFQFFFISYLFILIEQRNNVLEVWQDKQFAVT